MVQQPLTATFYSRAGRGGLMLALTPTEEQQQAVMEALKACGAPQVWSTTLA